MKNPTASTETNLFKTVALFSVAVGKVDRVVFSSSSAVYGDQKSIPTPEDAPKNPNSPYGLQKLQCEQYAKMFSDLYDLDVVCLRYFNVYGPRQAGDSPYSTAISSWCNRIHTGAPLRSDGDGSQTRDLVFVDDVADANISAANYTHKFEGECFNIASGTSYSNNEILDKFKDRFGDVEITHAPWRKGDVMHTSARISGSKFVLGFEAKTSLEEGLRQTWHWWNFDKRKRGENGS